MSKIKRFGLGAGLILALSSCANLFGPTPHENFQNHMMLAVGVRLDNPYTWADPNRLVSESQLLNGNIENEYILMSVGPQANCRYFYEYDPETRIIVGWRFEGSEEDCVVNP